MRGLLVDVNVQGHLPYLRRLIEALDLRFLIAELELDFVTFPDLALPGDLDDRSLESLPARRMGVVHRESKRRRPGLARSDAQGLLAKWSSSGSDTLEQRKI